ncbi:TAM domain methyltransferase [Peziza echinospora]|nr:TAM domain methyltransferase [Peziza echinospora]
MQNRLNEPLPYAQAVSSTMAESGRSTATDDVHLNVYRMEPDTSDDFSTISADSGDNKSYATSITPSVTDYQYENGRRYHSYREGEYVLPNDEKEQNRLDLFHHIFRMLLNGNLFAAPVQGLLRAEGCTRRPRVLDLGTGTGIWAIDVADEYPNADVVANDLSPIQPSNVPLNLRFEVDDVESPWPFGLARPFDFIHCRTLGGAIVNWEGLYRQAYQHLAIGGWMEVTELRMRFDSDNNKVDNSTSRHLYEMYRLALEKIGKTAEVAHLHRRWMVEAGFVNVTERLERIPSSPWPKDKKLKELGHYHMHNLLDAMDSYGLAPLTRILGMERVEAEVLLAAARAEIRDRKNHFYTVVPPNLRHFVFGQKPEGPVYPPSQGTNFQWQSSN